MLGKMWERNEAAYTYLCKRNSSGISHFWSLLQFGRSLFQFIISDIIKSQDIYGYFRSYMVFYSETDHVVVNGFQHTNRKGNCHGYLIML